MDPMKTRSIPRTFDEYIEQLPDEVIRALKVWLSLSEADRGQLAEALEQVKTLTKSQHERLPDITKDVPLGPWGKPCPYCGRE